MCRSMRLYRIRISNFTLGVLRVNEGETFYLGQCVARRQGLSNLMLQNARLIVASSVARGAFLMLQLVPLVAPFQYHTSSVTRRFGRWFE